MHATFQTIFTGISLQNEIENKSLEAFKCSYVCVYVRCWDKYTRIVPL